MGQLSPSWPDNYTIVLANKISKFISDLLLANKISSVSMPLDSLKEDYSLDQ